MGQSLIVLTLVTALACVSPCTTILAQFGGVPDQPFDAMEQPASPDYTKDTAWAALPHTADAADVVPEGVVIPEAQSDMG